jgi:formyltetrahydrofolate deformylase
MSTSTISPGKGSGNAVLLLSSPDQKGLVAKVAGFIYENGGNILSLNEHVDTDGNAFFLRVAWDLKTFGIPVEEISPAVEKLVNRFSANWNVYFSGRKNRTAVFASKYDHCIREILWRNSLGEFNTEIPLIISNHPDLEHLGERYHIPFHIFPVNQQNKAEMEALEAKLIDDHQVDTIVLARYMQVLSPEFVARYPNRIINIHHSFLPAFAGGNPYRQAFDRGVKIIGATSHYVTSELDEGPIIDQDIVRITHKDTVEDLKRKGRDLERLVLARALRLHAEHRVLVHGRKTVVFE